MPTYTYQCLRCNVPTQVYHAMSATPKITCSSCGSRRVKRLLGTGAGIIFKGSGFYETDYKRNGNGANGTSDGAAKSESTSEAKSESKPAASDSKAASSDKSKPKKKD